MADKPYTHLGHTNPWPFTGAVGLFVGFFGLLPLLYHNPVGWLLLVIGIGVFLIAVTGWLYDMTSEDISEAREITVPEFPKIGKWMVGFLILSEVFLFGALFATYFYLRNHDQIYTQSQLHFYEVDGKTMEVWGIFPILNTIFLVTSSVTVHFAEEALKHGKHKVFQMLLGITVVLGALFVAGQVYEFFNFAVKDNFTLFSGPFGSTFYSLTTLHGFHVTAGVVLLAYLFGGSFAGQLSPKRHAALSVVSIYWHFVDVIWIFLVAVLYLRLI